MGDVGGVVVVCDSDVWAVGGGVVGVRCWWLVVEVLVPLRYCGREVEGCAQDEGVEDVLEERGGAVCEWEECVDGAG